MDTMIDALADANQRMARIEYFMQVMVMIVIAIVASYALWRMTR